MHSYRDVACPVASSYYGLSSYVMLILLYHEHGIFPRDILISVGKYSSGIFI